MEQKYCNSFKNLSYRNAVLFLSFLWLAGILLGVALSFWLKEYAIPLMKALRNHRASVGGLCLVLMLPCLASYVSFKRSKQWPVYMIAFLKALCLGYSVPLSLWSFGTAAWLLHFLFSFSTMLPLVPLFCLWIPLINPERKLQRKYILLLLFVSVIFGLIDYYLVSPSVLTL